MMKDLALLMVLGCGMSCGRESDRTAVLITPPTASTPLNRSNGSDQFQGGSSGAIAIERLPGGIFAGQRSMALCDMVRSEATIAGEYSVKGLRSTTDASGATTTTADLSLVSAWVSDAPDALTLRIRGGLRSDGVWIPSPIELALNERRGFILNPGTTGEYVVGPQHVFEKSESGRFRNRNALEAQAEDLGKAVDSIRSSASCPPVFNLSPTNDIPPVDGPNSTYEGSYIELQPSTE